MCIHIGTEEKLLREGEVHPEVAQKKNYCQIKAEILTFMWVCGKSQFGQKVPLCMASN
jgi:hypothetical protein